MISKSIQAISLDTKHPFLKKEMFQLWESAKVTTPETGWEPVYFSEQDAFSYAYIKSHSFGEFIFDWGWADLFHRYQIPYYPKLLQAIPVSPVSAPKFLNPNQRIYKQVMNYYQANEFSSHHLLFTQAEEKVFFESHGYFYQKTLQYHFINRYASYDDFLKSLKARRRKNILKERRKVLEYPVQIVKKNLATVTQREKLKVYELYLATHSKKQSHPYLTAEFFKNLGQGFVYLAYKEEELMATSLFFEGEGVLYGRYWGIHPAYESAYRYLHFEMCFYLPIEYTIAKKLLRFEAGAQGEQKLLRGFTPVEIGSLHHIKRPEFYDAIKSFVSEQNHAYTLEIERLKEFLPYKD